MTFTNDFKPFAIAAGANVLSPSTWAADPSLAIGFQVGTASSAKANTAIRQASFVAAMIAQFTADNGPGNVQDNGNLATLESQFESALKSYLNSAAVFVPIVPSHIWYVDIANGVDAVGKGLSTGTGAFRTLQYAVNYISGFFSSSVVTINVAAGTYASAAHNNVCTIGTSLISSWSLVGAGVSSTILDGSALGGSAIFVSGAATVTVTGFTLKSYYYGAVCVFGNLTINTNNFVLTNSATSIGFSANGGNLLAVNATSTISGTGLSAFGALDNGFLEVGYHDVNTSEPANITFSGLTVSNGTCYSSERSLVLIDPTEATFTGIPTGKKYSIVGGSGVSTSGSPSIIPGTVAGTVDSATFSWIN